MILREGGVQRLSAGPWGLRPGDGRYAAMEIMSDLLAFSLLKEKPTPC